MLTGATPAQLGDHLAAGAEKYALEETQRAERRVRRAAAPGAAPLPAPALDGFLALAPSDRSSGSPCSARPRLGPLPVLTASPACPWSAAQVPAAPWLNASPGCRFRVCGGLASWAALALAQAGEVRKERLGA